MTTMLRRLFGFGEAAPAPRFTDGDYRTAAIKSFPHIHAIYTTIGNPPHEVAAHRAKTAALRVKAEAMTDPHWRKAYLGWCDYADRQADKSEQAYADAPRRSAEYAAGEERRRKRTAALLTERPPQ